MGRRAEGPKVKWRNGWAHVRFTWQGEEYAEALGTRDPREAADAAARAYADTHRRGRRPTPVRSTKTRTTTRVKLMAAKRKVPADEGTAAEQIRGRLSFVPSAYRLAVRDWLAWTKRERAASKKLQKKMDAAASVMAWLFHYEETVIPERAAGVGGYGAELSALEDEGRPRDPLGWCAWTLHNAGFELSEIAAFEKAARLPATATTLTDRAMTKAVDQRIRRYRDRARGVP